MAGVPEWKNSKATRFVLIFLIMLTFLSCHPKQIFRLFAPVAPQRPSSIKIGLALGGGGARGFAEIGVLRVLERENIPISRVSGTSVGSMIGALYCDAGSIADLEYHAETIEKDDVLDVHILSLLKGPGLIKGDKMEEFLRNNLRHKALEDLPIPLSIVATDLMTGQKKVFENGNIETAVHASCAIPGIFQPVRIGERTYVDGGMSDPVPVDVLKEKGMDMIIAVAIPPEIPQEQPQKAVEIFKHSMNVLFSRITEYMLRDTDVVILPKCSDVKLKDFSQREELIRAGEVAAMEAIPRIRELMEKKVKGRAS